ncbi:hypothetical protein LRZ95_01545 [Candidatus Gracilibacteria bacterium]|nr:hypothetical protein [Candidatus Gracilibacteria bacterium]
MNFFEVKFKITQKMNTKTKEKIMCYLYITNEAIEKLMGGKITHNTDEEKLEILEDFFNGLGYIKGVHYWETKPNYDIIVSILEEQNTKIK